MSSHTSPDGPQEDTYFQGRVNTTLNTINETLLDIKREMYTFRTTIEAHMEARLDAIDKKVNGILGWKNRLLGAFALVALIVPLFFDWLKERMWGK